jgi:cyclin L
MAPTASLEHLTNPLVTAEQLQSLQDDDRSRAENGQSSRFVQAILSQAAGILLRLPQEVIATSLVLLQRFWIEGHGQGHAAADLKVNETVLCLRMHKLSRIMQTASAASVYLAAKLSFTPVSPRSVCNVYGYLLSPSSSLPYNNPTPLPLASPPNPRSSYVSEGTYERERERILLCESLILSSIGFDVHVALPHTLGLTYLQALGVSSKKLASRVLEHLNGGLLSPQLVYLTHQPNALAVAAIYLAAKEVGVKLVDGNWWEVFDVEREDLGFLVLAFGSFEGFAVAEKEKWDDEAGNLWKLLRGG